MKSFIAKVMGLAMAALGVTPSFAVDRTVGVGKDFTTINSAILGSAAGDTIIVYGGTYIENLWLDRPVTITEAPGEVAVLQTTTGNTPANQPNGIDLTGAGVVWDGIDINLGTADRTFLIWASGASSGTFRNMTFGDSLAAAANGNVGLASTGTLSHIIVENCQFAYSNLTLGNLVYVQGNGLITISTSTLTCIAGTSLVVNEATGAGTSGTITLNNCEVSKPSGNSELAQIYQGELVLNDCTLHIAPAAKRIITFPGLTDQTVLTANRTIFDMRGSSDATDIRAIQMASATPTATSEGVANITNCQFIASPLSGANGAGAAIRASGGGNLVLKHNTFVSVTSNSLNRAIYGPNASNPASVMNVIAENNIFYLPGATGPGAGAIVTAGAGTINVTATKNLLFTGGGSGLTSDTLNGTIVTFDPELKADLLHLTSSSPALNAGVASTVTDDFDGNTRPQYGGVDLGADEYFLDPATAQHWAVY